MLRLSSINRKDSAKRRHLAVLQTCVPDYRVIFFRELGSVFGKFTVAAGSEYFSPSVVGAAKGEPWYVELENVFFFGRSLLWQRGAVQFGLASELLVVEWNPRIVTTWFLLVLRLLKGQRTLVWGHANSRNHGGQLIRNWMSRLSFGIIAYTSSEALLCRRQNPGLPVWVAPNSAFRSSQEVSFLLPHGSVRNVVYVGRLTREKKPEILVRAWAVLRSSNSVPQEAKLLLVGDGPESQRISALISTMGLSESISMPGHISDEQQLRRIYESALVAISPGYVGLSAIQCMSYGVPMLISRDEPHSPEIEACREEENCRFFTTDDVKDLVRVLGSFYREREVWIGRRRNIGSLIASRYSVELMANGFIDSVEGLGSAPGAPLRIALVWAQFGPYHHARMRAWKSGQEEFVIIGLELASRTQTYLWKRDSRYTDIHALETTQSVERMGAWRTYRRALRFFRLANIQVVFVPSYWPASSLAVRLAAYRVGARVVMMNESHAHTGRASGLRLAMKQYLVRSFDAALVGGRLQRGYFASLGLSEDLLFDGYDAVDNEYFSRRADECRREESVLRERFCLPPRYFLNIGRMEPKKNLATLIRAYAIARNEVRDFPRLVLVGSGQSEQSLRRQCVTEGLSFADLSGAGRLPHAPSVIADVLFYGFRQQDELPVFYSLARAFVLPSAWEEWGLVVNEAMASGLPVIVSDVAGCAPDLVKSGENGYLFSPENAEELAACLRLVGSDERKAREMGEESRRMIQKWGLERFSENATRSARAALRRSDRNVA